MPPSKVDILLAIIASEILSCLKEELGASIVIDVIASTPIVGQSEENGQSLSSWDCEIDRLSGKWTLMLNLFPIQFES